MKLFRPRNLHDAARRRLRSLIDRSVRSRRSPIGRNARNPNGNVPRLNRAQLVRAWKSKLDRRNGSGPSHAANAPDRAVHARKRLARRSPRRGHKRRRPLSAKLPRGKAENRRTKRSARRNGSSARADYSA